MLSLAAPVVGALFLDIIEAVRGQPYRIKTQYNYFSFSALA
jgi:hypothetical protein